MPEFSLPAAAPPEFPWGGPALGDSPPAEAGLPRVLKAPESILPLVAAGNRDAMERCLERYENLVWSAARRYLGASAEAEDIVQEIFIELWQKAGRYDPTRASESTFVMLIARRRLLDERRRQSRQPAVAPLERAEERESQPEAGSALDDDARQVLGALQGLPAEQQRLLKMSLGEGLTHAEISAQTAVPLGTVKTLLRRGLLRLREATRRFNPT